MSKRDHLYNEAQRVALRGVDERALVCAAAEYCADLLKRLKPTHLSETERRGYLDAILFLEVHAEGARL